LVAAGTCGIQGSDAWIRKLHTVISVAPVRLLSHPTRRDKLVSTEKEKMPVEKKTGKYGSEGQYKKKLGWREILHCCHLSRRS
jgi:hypothetical protein